MHMLISREGTTQLQTSTLYQAALHRCLAHATSRACALLPGLLVLSLLAQIWWPGNPCMHAVRSICLDKQANGVCACMQADAGSAGVPAGGGGDDKEDTAGALPARSVPGRPLHHDPARPHPCPRHARPGARTVSDPTGMMLVLSLFSFSLMHSITNANMILL